MKNVKTIHRQITIYKRKGVIYGIYLCIGCIVISVACFIWLLTPKGQKWLHEK